MSIKNIKAQKDTWLLGVLASLLGLGAFETGSAQITSSSNQIQSISGYVYQGGRNKGIKQTTSYVSLPNLNEILAPTPVAKPKPVPAPQARRQAPVTHTHTVTTRPRFGYQPNQPNSLPSAPEPQQKLPTPTSSVPTGPGDLDPLVPIDPGYDKNQAPLAQPDPPATLFQFPEVGNHVHAPTPAPALPQVQPPAPAPVPQANHNHPHSHSHSHPHTHPPVHSDHHHHQGNTIPQGQISQPIIQLNRGSSCYSFSHNYYPRTYQYGYPRSSYSYYPYSFGRSTYYNYRSLGYNSYYPYSIYSSRAPLRGSRTSSLNYLSGFRYKGLSRLRF